MIIDFVASQIEIVRTPSCFPPLSSGNKHDQAKVQIHFDPSD